MLSGRALIAFEDRLLKIPIIELREQPCLVLDYLASKQNQQKIVTERRWTINIMK